MYSFKRGFTIVELLVIIVVIGILAGVVIISYGNWNKNLRIDQVKSDLTAAAAAMENSRNFSSGYPASVPGTASPGPDVVFSGGGLGTATYCIDATHQKDVTIKYYATPTSQGPQEGSCATTWGQVGAGRFHTCAVNMRGQAYCWGKNDVGQLGNNTTSAGYTTSPVAVYTTGVLAGKVVTDIDGGEDWTCAIADNKPYCWGLGTSGQLATGSTYNSSSVAVAVDSTNVLAGKKITKLTVGLVTACVLADGLPYCWGSGWQGQLGNGATAVTSTGVVPVTISGLSGASKFIDIDAANHICAVDTQQRAYCWGDGTSGKLGNGTSPSGQSLPVAVDMTGALAGQKIAKVSAGSSFSCAVTTTSSVYCWGNNAVGQLGNGTTTASTTPVAATMSGALAGKSIKQISSSTGGYHFTCVLSTDGLTYCWGANGDGQVGINTTVNATSPAAVLTTGVLSGKIASDVSTGDQACVSATGRIYCWGSGSTGQLGNGTTTRSLVPLQVNLSY